jgi:hypothetical protein
MFPLQLSVCRGLTLVLQMLRLVLQMIMMLVGCNVSHSRLVVFVAFDVAYLLFVLRGIFLDIAYASAVMMKQTQTP